MKKFVFTGPSFEGEIIFKFDFNGYLKEFSNNAELTESQKFNILTMMPKVIDDIQLIKNKYKDLNVKELVDVPVFAQFWDAYNYKEDKIECIKLWDKLTDMEKIEAFQYIPKYDQKLKQTNLGKKYPKTYLRNKPWIK